MDDQRTPNPPQAPETQPADIREQLHQENISKQGQPRDAAGVGPEPDSHFGAVEDDRSGHVDMTPVTPPMEGPYNLVGGEEDNLQDMDVDPQDEINDAG